MRGLFVLGEKVEGTVPILGEGSVMVDVLAGGEGVAIVGVEGEVDVAGKKSAGGRV